MYPYIVFGTVLDEELPLPQEARENEEARASGSQSSSTQSSNSTQVLIKQPGKVKRIAVPPPGNSRWVTVLYFESKLIHSRTEAANQRQLNYIELRDPAPNNGGEERGPGANRERQQQVEESKFV